MIRSFLAIPLPSDMTDALDDIQTGLPGVNWAPEENLHLTLAFLGEQPRPLLEDLDAGLLRLAGAGFALTLRGVGAFGGAKPRLIYAGVAESEPLRRLQAKVATAVRGAGVDLAGRRYAPHVTLARFAPGRVRAEAVQAYLAAQAMFEAGPFDVSAFHLYRSDLGRDGARYETLARYPLTA